MKNCFSTSFNFQSVSGEKNMEPKTSILVVDDDAGTCEILSDIFEDEGYQVATANSGRQAMDKAEQTAFDAALIDFRLPDTDGIALLQEFKKSYPEMVCIIITGHAGLENAIEALKQGADGYFTKPLVIVEIICQVEQALDKRRLQRELRESEKKIRILFDYVGDAIFIYDPKGRFLEVNRTACKLLGYSREDLLQMAPMDIETPEYAVLEPKRIEELKSKEHIFFETVYVTRHGKLIPIELSSRIIDFEKKPAILNIARDITQRKQMENELKDRLRDLRKALRGTIRAMALTVETRDPYTAGHQQRVADLARAIAKEMGFPKR